MPYKLYTAYLIETSTGNMKSIYNNGNSFYVLNNGKWVPISNNPNYFRLSWAPRKGEIEPNVNFLGKLSNLRKNLSKLKKKRGGTSGTGETVKNKAFSTHSEMMGLVGLMVGLMVGLEENLCSPTISLTPVPLWGHSKNALFSTVPP